MAGASLYPVSNGSNYSSQPPENSSRVLLDGQLVSSSSISTSINGSGGTAYLYANGAGPLNFTIGSNNYVVSPGSIVETSAFSGSTSVNVSCSVKQPVTWAYAGSLPTQSSPAWDAIAYGLVGGTTPTFVAVQDFGSSVTTAAISTNNGASWSSVTLPEGSLYRSIIYGGGYFVTPQTSGTNTGTEYILYSTNGTSWSVASAPAAGGYAGIAYGNGYFVASGDNTTAYATNPSTWTAGAAAGGGINQSMAYAMVGSTPTFVMVGFDTFVSTNYGTSWSNPLSGSVTAICAGYPSGSPLFVQIYIDSTTYYYSPDGFSWSSGTLPIASPNCITYAVNYFVMLGYTSSEVAYSANGVTWTALSFINDDWSGIAYGNGSFVGITSYTGNSAVSTPAALLPAAFGIYAAPTTTH